MNMGKQMINRGYCYFKVLYNPALFRVGLDYILSALFCIRCANQHLVDELHTHWVLGCGLPISFRTSISILPYHESLPVPQTMLPCLFGWDCFRAFPSIWWFLAEGSLPLTGLNSSLHYFFTSYPSQFCLSLTYHNSSDIFTTINRAGFYNPDHGKITRLRV